MKTETKKDMNHQQLDRRSLALHALVAKKIKDDPSLIDTAKHNIARWRDMANKNFPEPYYLKAWEDILNQGADSTIAFLLSSNEYSTQLRQSSPFTGILTEQERTRFFESWAEGN